MLTLTSALYAGSVAHIYFFPIAFVTFALVISLPPSRNSDPGSHSRLFFPPTHDCSCLAFFSREDSSSFSYLIGSRRNVLAHARRSQQLILLLFCFCKYIQTLATAGFELTDQHY